ncbi:MAG: ABC transporter substrate-binding protein, partial [Marinobacter alexandrii]
MAFNAPAFAAGDSTGSVEARHGIAMHGSPKYPQGFAHFDYVNPEAPKGGTLKMAVVANGFDSFNPFDIRGVAAAGI